MYRLDNDFFTFCLENEIEAACSIERYGLMATFRDWILNGKFTLPIMTRKEIEEIIEKVKKEDEEYLKKTEEHINRKNR